MDHLKYPVGEYKSNRNPDSATLEQWISDIESFPENLKNSLDGVTYDALNWRYRPDGWTVKQVVHHCADSHMNAMVRFKLALTEGNVTIRPYFEDRWANLVDYQEADLSSSLRILEGLHAKFGLIMRAMTPKHHQLELVHPEYDKTYSIVEYIGNYAWHCNHHLAHVNQGLASNGKYNT